MPQVVVAAAVWVTSAIGTILGGSAIATTIATAIGHTIATLGFAQGLMAGVSAWATVGAMASLGAGQRKPRVGVGAGGSQVDFQADPDAGLPLVMGRSGTAGVAIHQTTNGQANKNNVLLFAVALTVGPMEGLDGFFAANEAVVLTAGAELHGGGTALAGKYANALAVRVQLGAKPEVPWPPPVATLGSVDEWTNDHVLSGIGAAWYAMVYSPEVYTAGPPPPLFVVKGPGVYDPRLDGTYPGGAGARDWSDDLTWGFAGNDNGYLQALSYAAGRTANGVRTIGMGLPAAAIDRAAFVEGANIAEANGWTMGGVVRSTDRKIDVMSACLQAAGGQLVRLGGQISCVVNAPRVSLKTITGDDLAGRVVVTGTRSRRDRFNRVVPRYRSEDHNWEIVAAAPVEVGTYVTEDGGARTREIEYPLVQDKDVAAQLAAYDICNSREFGPIILPCKPYMAAFKPGDCITVDDAELGLVAQPVIVLTREIDPISGTVTLTCQSETDAKHPFALGLTGVAPNTPSLSGVDASHLDAPGVAAFNLNGATLDGDRPILTLTGEIDDPNAVSVVARYRIDGSADDWAFWPPVAGFFGETIRIEITGVEQDVDYEVESAYLSSRGIRSAWTPEGVATAGSFDAAAFLSYSGKNLWRLVDYVPFNGAAAVDPSALGESLAAWTFPGGAGAAVGVKVSGKVFGLNEYYSFQLNHKLTTGAGTATIRCGWREAGTGGTGLISDVADNVITVSTSEGITYWEGVFSADADFVNAEFWIFSGAGDIGAGKVVSIYDLQMEYASKSSLGWRPSPDDVKVLRYSGYLGSLDATRNQVFVQSGAPGAPANGDVWVDTTTTPYVLKIRNAGAWQVSASDGGSFGSNLYHTPGGTLATLSNFLTSVGTAALITGQAAWATYTSKTPTGALAYVSAAGKITYAPALGTEGAGFGQAIAIDHFPLSADDTHIYIDSFTLAGFGGYSRSISGYTFSSMPPGGVWHIICYMPTGGFGLADNSDLDTWLATGDWLFLGTMGTSVSSTFPPAPDPEPGYYGGGAGDDYYVYF